MASAALSLPYTPLATAEDESGEEDGSLRSVPAKSASLSAGDKWRLVRPLLGRYMLPLCKPLHDAFDFHITLTE